jgi:A/G-specific adenine glycosylase
VSEWDVSGLLERARQLNPDLSDRLVVWQRSQGRHHLPWQQTRDPYRVWLSEIMLQQTQVSTVLGYYARFLARFPSVGDLANAELDEVLALWSGLGYYSRARNLHRCARIVRDDHGGRFPCSAALLVELPGIGPSTAAAIAAFCFGERISIMDGNVRRVLSRALGWGGDLSVRGNERALGDAAQQLVPARSDDMVAYTQGLMDLGATLCTPRKPSCLDCPWSELCEGRRSGEPERLPVKTSKLKRSQRASWCLWLQRGDAVWLVQRPHTGIWSGLWTLPMFAEQADLDAAWPHPAEAQPPVTHVLTHLDWRLHLARAQVSVDVDCAVDLDRVMSRLSEPVHGDGKWVPLAALGRGELALPKPFQRWLIGG